METSFPPAARLWTRINVRWLRRVVSLGSILTRPFIRLNRSARLSLLERDLSRRREKAPEARRGTPGA